ncbi:hypothetical protein B0O99DRAFT_91778 [Bisporella sp. PMI_857]|nr:hypothetical protein B0O99DRAFT_91778 [Bisporella sp. PMI_857]
MEPQFLGNLEKSKPSDGPAALRLDSIHKLRAAYAEVRKHLVRGRIEEAHTLLKELFTWRGKLYNETHTRIKRFINPLLKSFCLAWKFSIAQGRDQDFHPQRVNFINDLLEFCLESKKYEELEILLQECRCPISETRADSSNDIFRPWSDDTGVQGQLAQLGQVGPPRWDSFYWEDSRMYCRTWDSLVMARTFPDDPMPYQPIAVTVHPERIEYHNAGQEQQFKDSEILAVLERKREANDWEILSAWETASTQYQRAAVKALASTSGPHKIWVFPEDIVERKITSLNQGQQEDMYRFYHLELNRSEWMTIRHPCKSFANDSYNNPNEPRDPKKGGWAHSRYRTLGAYDRDVRKNSSIQKEKYNIEETDGFNIKVTVPFVPWEHFETSAMYQAGLAFRDYMAIMLDGLGGSYHYFEDRAKLCKDTSQDKQPDWVMPIGSGGKECRTGFFGSTPSGKALVLRDRPLASINLVSTRWRDWKCFSLQRAAQYIALQSGEIVPCLGSINGSWMYEEEADLQWDGIQIFVVDLTIKDESNQTFNFVLSEASLRPEKTKALTSPEMRFFGAKLSPHLFRHAPPYGVAFGSKWRKFEKLETAAVFDEDARQWEETNRRENWDRNYEKRLRAYKKQPNNAGVMDVLNAEYEIEQARRRDWDTKDQ